MSLSQLLSDSASKLGIEVSDSELDLFVQYLGNLKKWNTTINLTAITDDREILINHFIDSISIVPLFKGSGNILDIGSGGGFPGIPIKIIRPQFNITLLDSVNKKVSFMKDTIRKLGLEDIDAVWARAEDPNNGISRNSFDYVVTRAVGDITEVADLSSPYLSEQGVIVLMRGKKGKVEWEESNNDISVRFELVEIHNFTLPGTDHLRTILVLKPLQ